MKFVRTKICAIESGADEFTVITCPLRLGEICCQTAEFKPREPVRRIPVRDATPDYESSLVPVFVGVGIVAALLIWACCAEW